VFVFFTKIGRCSIILSVRSLTLRLDGLSWQRKFVSISNCPLMITTYYQSLQSFTSDHRVVCTGHHEKNRTWHFRPIKTRTGHTLLIVLFHRQPREDPRICISSGTNHTYRETRFITECHTRVILRWARRDKNQTYPRRWSYDAW